MEQRFPGFILALFFAFATAGPINIELFKDSRTCAKRCIDNHKFDYNVGNVYVYEYEANSKTGIVGASEDSASIRIKATVEIEATSSCDFEMKLKEVSLLDPYRSQEARFSPSEFSEILAQWPLRFSFQDGRIEDLCPNAEDPSWSLNIKRGILSAFQNSMTRFDLDQTITETDITGSCETKYTVSDSGDDTIIKTKDFVSCKHRQAIQSTVQSIGYDASSHIQSLAIMKSSYICTQKINEEKILDESTCTEKHIFRPFSNGDNGASTVNTQKMRFVRTKRGGRARQEEIRQRTDLLFSHQFGARSSGNVEDKIKTKLQDLCQISQDDVRPEQPQHFNELVREMKKADISTLNSVYKQVKNQRICRGNPEKIMKIFRDAIPMVGTSSSLQLISDLIWKREVTDTEKDMWLASLAFIQYPEKEMISAIQPLLDDKNVEGNTILLISSLVSGYCSVNPNCGDVVEVTKIMDTLERLIGKCSSKGPFEKTVFALRAIGNIGHSKSIVPRLTQCFTRRENPVQIRLAAIDAFRRIPCDVMRVDLLDLFNDISEDSELRINAYLALMKCPHKNVLMRIKEALRNEKTNQVGSFVWTHLTNLKETSDPHLQDVRAILEDEELKKEFNKDKRKFSRNYEGSFFFDEFNVGGKVDSNIIFSPESFVPRSANLNLTVDLFGRAINFFEFGTRMEGVERFLERYFGNGGLSKSKSNSGKSQNSQIGTFDSKYKVDIDTLKGFAYIRMFGNELGFWQFEDPNLSFFKNFDTKKWVKDEKISFSKNMALMDTHLIVPTIMGLPLNLTVATTASVDVEAMGKMNLASLKNIEFGGSIKPSGSVNVVSEMTVDAFATKAGLRMNSIAHSSTEAKMSFKMKNSKMLESKFELPKKRMDIITFKSDFAIIQGDMVKTQKMIEDNRVNKNKCTGENFNKITGMKLCTQFQFANASMRRDAPYFPFTGPVMMQVELINQDAPEGYMMKMHMNEPTQSGFVIDTPNSRNNRKISFDFDVKNMDKKIEFDSPWMKLTFNGKLIKNRKTRLLSGELILDNKNSKVYKYSASFQLDYTSVKGEARWEPKIVIMSPTRKMVLDGTVTSFAKRVKADLKAVGFYRDEISLKLSTVISKREYSCITTLRVGPKEYYLKTKFGMLPKGKAVQYSSELLFISEGKELVKLESSFLYNPKSKIILNIMLDKVFSKIVALNMRILRSMKKKKKKDNLNFNLKGPKVLVDVKGSMEFKDKRITTKVDASYNIGNYQDKLTIYSKLNNMSTKSTAIYDGDLTVDSKRNKNHNIALKGRYGIAKNQFEKNFYFEFGNPKKTSEKITFESILSFHFKPIEKNFNYSMAFKIPSQNVDAGFKLNHLNSQKFQTVKIENDMEVKYGPDKSASTKIQFSMKNKKNFEGFASVKHIGKELFRLEEKLTSKNPQNYDNRLSITIPDGRQVTLQSEFEKKSDKSFYMANVLRLPNNREVKINNKLQIERENGSLYIEVDADRDTIRSTPWNPKLTFDYHIKIYRQKVNLLKYMLSVVMSPTEEIKAMYTFSERGDETIEDFLMTTPFPALKKLESKYTRKYGPNSIFYKMLTKRQGYSEYKEEITVKSSKDSFLFEYLLDQTFSESHIINVHCKCSSNNKMSMGLIKYKTRDDLVNLELNVDYLPTKVDVKANADMSLPRNGFEFHMKSVSTSTNEFSFNSDGEVKLQHPKVILELTYFAQVDANRIRFDTNFLSPTSRHKNGKLAIDIAKDEERTRFMGKFDVDYNDRRLYSLNTGYKYEDRTHNFQLAFLLPNGERITTILNFSLSRKKIHAEIKLPRAFKSFELDMDGSVECLSRECDYNLRLTTNAWHFRKMLADMKVTEMGLIDLKFQFNGFDKNMEFDLKIEGREWSKKTITSDFKIDGEEKLKLDGNYMFQSPRKFDAKFQVVSKIGKHEDKFDFNVHNELIRRDRGELKISGQLELFNKRYEATLMAKDYKEVNAKLITPKLNYGAALTANKLKSDDFDIMLKLQQDSDEHRLSFLNRHFQEMKISAELASFKDFNIVYNGGIDDRKQGSFQLKISYGEYFIESNSTVNLNNQYELKSSVAYKILTRAGRNPKVHTGSGEINLMQHVDSIFQKILVTFTYGKEKINFSSLIKNTGKINMNMRLKTTLKFDANLKAQIKPDDMYNTDLSLNFDTKWTGPQKLTYSHSGQKGKTLLIKADLAADKGREPKYTIEAKISMKNVYGLNIKVTTNNMADVYIFDGELMLARQKVEGKLRVEGPFFPFTDEKLMEIKFSRDKSEFTSSGKFMMMEYSMDVEYSPKSVMAKTYINWNKKNRASNFNFIMNFDDASYDAKTDKKFEMKLIHPVRTVSFLMKYVKNRNMFDIDIEFSGNVEKDQKLGFGFGRTQNAGYVKLALPERTYKLSGRLNREYDNSRFDGSFFWNLDKDDSKKIDLTASVLRRSKNAILDMTLKFPSQSKGVRLKTELDWQKGDTLFKSRTEFSMNQDPNNVLTAQTELLKDDNNKYTLTMAVMHPKSNLNLLTTFRMFELNNKLTASMDMKYGNKNANWMAYLDKNNNEVSMQMRSPRHSLEIVGHYIMEDDYEISAKMHEGSGRPVEAYINLSPSRKNLKVQVDYESSGPEKSYRIDGNLMTNKMIMVEAFKMDDDDKMTDVRMDFKLEDPNIMHGKIKWRPEIIIELNEYLYRKMLENTHQMKVIMRDFYATMSGESKVLANALQRAYQQEISEIDDYMSKEFNEISRETMEMFQHVSEMYDRNYLNLKSTFSHVLKLYYEFESNLMSAVYSFAYQFREGFMSYYRMLIPKMREAMAKYNQLYQESYRKLAYDIEQAKLYVMNKLTRLNRQWERTRDEYLRKLNELNRRTYQAFFNHKYTKAFMMAINHRWDDLVDFLRRNQMMKPVSDAISYLQTNMKDFNVQMEQLMDKIKNHPVMNEIVSAMNELYQQLVWAYKYWEIEETVRNFDDKVKNYITSTANHYREQIFSMNQMELITFDLRRGEIEFKVPVVVPKFIMENKEKAEQFWKMMKVTVNKFNDWHIEYNFTIADFYYSMKPSLDHADWIPPFKAQASIFRDQHITTFDGTHLDFKGACSYVLTRDFADKSFLVIANFGRINNDQKIESILFYDRSEKLEIFHDYEIRHNDNKVDLPIILKDVSINRIGHILEIRRNSVYTITFIPSQGTVIVDISGWYFGKVAGLLGTYNNEQFDEMLTPEQRLARNVDDFAFSWAMPRCRSSQNYAQPERKFYRCTDWFLSSDSPFRSCFRQVEPDSFYHACNTAHTPELDICTVARFYVDRCAEKGVPLNIPDQCLTCKTKRGFMFMPGEEVTFSDKFRREEIEHSADIVFVVEKRKCNEKSIADLNRIIQELEQTLGNGGMRNNRYGLVGFGGENIHGEYSITIKSELMATAGLMMNEVRKLDLYDGYSKIYPLNAINLAAQYPFRPTVRKTIILVACNMLCNRKVSYQQVLNQLKEHDIALHLLQEYDFEMLGNKSPKTTNLYGIDSKQVFTKTDNNAKEKLFETIKLPSGDCAELALASNGSVFDAAKMSRGDKSIFVNRFTQRIMDSLEMVNCQTCACSQNKMGMAQSICRRCPSIIKQTPYIPYKLFL